MVAYAEDELKAQSIIIMDVRKISSFTDFYVICTGVSTTQLKAISHNVHKRLKEKGITYLACEGLRKTNWIVMDYGDVIVHIFNEETRKYYDLERLWGDAKTIDWDKEKKK